MDAATETTDLDLYTSRSVRPAELDSPWHRSSWRKIVILLLCIGFSYISAVTFSQRFRAIYGGTSRPDFGAIYFGVRCAIHHLDPYNFDAAIKTFRAEGGTFPTDTEGAGAQPIIIGRQVNLPTTLLLAAPLGLLPYSAAQALWILLTIVLLVSAGYLVWTVGEGWGSVLCGCFIGISLANCQQMLMVGNVAGIVVSLCVVATWCFLKNRNIPLGVFLFALSLALKPHDSGFVWLYFLLAGGVMRKRALQTLAVTCAIGIAAAAWIAPVSPHWFHELHDHHVAVAELGSTSDPSPSGVTSGRPGAILDLQAVFSVFIKDARFYNLASYLIAGSLIAGWAWIVIRRRMTPDGAWLALAAIAVLSLLPVYHRAYDAKLLLLAVPACARLWSKGGARRWLSLGFTLGGVFFTSDLFIAFFVSLFVKPSVSSMPTPRLLAVSLVPPIALLAMGCFYLWVFIRDRHGEPAGVAPASEALAVSTAG